MAEQGGFFRRIFSFGQKPDEGVSAPQANVDRRAEDQDLVAAPDIATRQPGSPDNDAHQLAAASSNADTEAGAKASEASSGRTEPLNPAPPPSAQTSSGASTEKKTPNS